jgi:very-short-patch-repair endonuclease
MPHQKVPAINRTNAKQMRRQPTEEENILWQAIRGRKLEKLKFKRQVPIGNYIVDFVCMEENLIVEVDGVQHADSEYDKKRDDELAERGFTILRFWNDEVRNDLVMVCDTILAATKRL